MKDWIISFVYAAALVATLVFVVYWTVWLLK